MIAERPRGTGVWGACPRMKVEKRSMSAERPRGRESQGAWACGPRRAQSGETSDDRRAAGRPRDPRCVGVRPPPRTKWKTSDDRRAAGRPRGTGAWGWGPTHKVNNDLEAHSYDETA